MNIPKQSQKATIEQLESPGVQRSDVTLYFLILSHFRSLNRGTFKLLNCRFLRLFGYGSFFFCLIACVGFAGEPAKRSICLNMIVKDEAPVILRCLKSVKPLIDYWVIVDTGSTDGTQKVIKEFMSDLPGELHERPWVNFGHNRNEALRLARGKGDYLLFIDADEELEGSFDKRLQSSVYFASFRISQSPHVSYPRAFLIDNRIDSNWVGVIHESLTWTQGHSSELLQNVAVSSETKDGHRSQDPQKFLKDAQTLERALIDEPDNAEYVFYLGQSYYNAGKYSLALEQYKKRAEMPGWDQTAFWAKYFSGCLQETLKMDPKIFIKSYSDAFHFRPTRAEPLFRMANHYYTEGNYILAYALTKTGLEIPVPDDAVYVEDWIYAHGMLGVFANSAKALGKTEEAIASYKKLSKISGISEFMQTQAISTKEFLEEQRTGTLNK